MNYKERAIIASLRYIQHSIRVITGALSTISRELQRNGRSRTYDDEISQRRANTRSINAHRRTLILGPFLRSYIHEHLTLGWSPQQITGRLTLTHPHHKTHYESMYHYIYKEASHLVRLLRRRHRIHKKKRAPLPTKSSWHPSQDSNQ